MRYFRNTELAKLYDISEKTVRNWIKQSKEGKLNFDIYTDEKGRAYIAETTKNTLLIKDQIEGNKKYRNSKTHKVVEPKQEFYDIYTSSQIYDIISHLEKFNEFLFHYAHMGNGSQIFADYYLRLKMERILNTQAFSDDFLKNYENGILQLFPQDALINVIELGSRTALTTQDFIKSLQKRKKLSKYISVDISKDMLNINQANITKWFGNDIDHVLYKRDVIRDRLDDILLESSVDNTKNLILFLGGILHAFNDRSLALRNIHESMGVDDYFMVSTKLDSEPARRYFDFNPTFESELLPQKERFLVDVLNIEPSFYDVEQYYDEQERQRKIQVRLKFDVTVKFKLQKGTKSLDFKKGESIMLWRFWHQTMEEMVQEFTECGFNVVQAIKSPDEQYAMLIAKVRTDKNKHC